MKSRPACGCAEEIFHPLNDSQHTQLRADSALARAESVAESIFLVSVTHVKVTVPGKPESHQPATWQGTQHGGQGTLVGKRQKDVLAGGLNYEVNTLEHKPRLWAQDIGLQQDRLVVLWTPPGKPFDQT